MKFIQLNARLIRAQKFKVMRDELSKSSSDMSEAIPTLKHYSSPEVL